MAHFLRGLYSPLALVDPCCRPPNFARELVNQRVSGDSWSELEATLRSLVDPSSIAERSGDRVYGNVGAAITRADERYKEKQQEPPRRKPRLAPLPQAKGTFVDVAPLSVLHALGRSISLD